MKYDKQELKIFSKDTAYEYKTCEVWGCNR